MLSLRTKDRDLYGNDFALSVYIRGRNSTERYQEADKKRIVWADDRASFIRYQTKKGTLRYSFILRSRIIILPFFWNKLRMKLR